MGSATFLAGASGVTGEPGPIGSSGAAGDLGPVGEFGGVGDLGCAADGALKIKDIVNKNAKAQPSSILNLLNFSGDLINIDSPFLVKVN
ncbi:MAG TPA: hypothetical protein PLB05_08580 [Candidatus Omnitrophota bacterium]|nr:hypothetical protein [Candidatus Omnitrophota bacterium]